MGHPLAEAIPERHSAKLDPAVLVPVKRDQPPFRSINPADASSPEVGSGWLERRASAASVLRVAPATAFLAVVAWFLRRQLWASPGLCARRGVGVRVARG